MTKEVLFTRVDPDGSSYLCLMDFYDLVKAFHDYSKTGTQKKFLIHVTGLKHQDMMCLLDDRYLDFVWVYTR